MSEIQHEINHRLVLLTDVGKNLPEGPWTFEPLRFQFVHVGFDCLLQRSLNYSWCGYVGIPSTHKFYGRDYKVLQRAYGNIPSHRGLTYSEKCQGSICHDKQDGDHLWWIGFDCAHAYDVVPTYTALSDFVLLSHRSKYRDFFYVKKIVEQLAEFCEEKDKRSTN